MKRILLLSKNWYKDLEHKRTGRALSGLAADYLGTLVTVVLAFVLTPVLVMLLSAPMYGFWLLTTQILFWLNLLDGGANIYLIKVVASKKDEGHGEHLKEVISTSIWSYAFLALLTILIGLSLAPWVPIWAKISDAETQGATLTFMLAVVTASISLVTIPTFYGILQGYQRLVWVSGIIYFVSAFNLLAAVGLLILGWGIEAMAVAQLCGTLVGASMAFYLARRVCVFSLSPRHFRMTELRRIFAFTIHFQMSKLAFLASTYSDGVLIAGVQGTAAVTTFSLTQKLSATGSMFINKVGSMIMPGLAELFAQHDKVRLQEVMLGLTRVLVRIGLLSMTFIIAINERLVSLWVGTVFFGGAVLTVLFAYNMLRNGVIRNLAAFFFSSGELTGWGWLSLAEAVVKISLTIILLPRLGLIAPVAATAIAELITGVYTPIKLSHLIELPLLRWWYEGVWLVIIRSLPTIAVVGGLGLLLPFTWGWWAIALIGLGGLAVNTLTFDLKQMISVLARFHTVARAESIIAER